MPNKTIASHATVTLSSTVASGTDIEFLNNAGDSGTLVIEPSALFAETAGNPPTLTGETLGGTVTNFLPGDEIVLINIDKDFDKLNVQPGNTAANAAFADDTAYAAKHGDAFFIAPDGTVTDNFNATVNPATAKMFFDDMRDAIFGKGPIQATLTISFAIDPVLHKPDLIISTDAPVNPCFAAGTRILTTRGDVAVETLKPGDIAVTHRGLTRKIVWVGRRNIDIARHPIPESVLPVIIEPGALGENTPARRLTVSPDHALYIDGLLIQAKDLINGAGIRQSREARAISYFHVELDRHDIVLANGAPAESYLDTGHRGVFDNADEPLILHPELMQIRREAEGCAPLCMGGEALFRIRERLADLTWSKAAASR
jgi:hypothetical protein